MAASSYPITGSLNLVQGANIPMLVATAIAVQAAPHLRAVEDIYQPAIQTLVKVAVGAVCAHGWDGFAHAMAAVWHMIRSLQ